MEEWIRKGKREIGRFVDCLMGSGVGWVERFNANLATKDNGGAAFQQPHLSDRYSETQHLNQTHVLIIKLGFTRVARFQTESNLKVKWNVWCFWLEGSLCDFCRTRYSIA